MVPYNEKLALSLQTKTQKNSRIFWMRSRTVDTIAFHPQQSIYLVSNQNVAGEKLNFTQRQQQSNYSSDHYRIYQQQ